MVECCRVIHSQQRKLSAVEVASVSKGQSTARLVISKLPEKAAAPIAKRIWAHNIQALLEALTKTMVVLFAWLWFLWMDDVK